MLIQALFISNSKSNHLFFLAFLYSALPPEVNIDLHPPTPPDPPPPEWLVRGWCAQSSLILTKRSVILIVAQIFLLLIPNYWKE